MKRLMQLLRENASAERKPVNLVRAEGSADATIYIYDTIDPWWGVNAKDVAQAVAVLDASTTLHLRINSPGGDVFEARAIAASLRGFGGKVVAHIDALAASAATTVAMAADEVEISDGAFFMIHNAWCMAMGDKTALTEMAALLGKVDDGIVADYAKRTGKPVDEIVTWMNAETWFTAQEAVDNGFADRLATIADKSKNATARTWNLAVFEHAPAALTDPVAPAVEEQMAAAHAQNQRRLRLLEVA
jgi:ATP-dependent Clp protease protease subunit